MALLRYALINAAWNVVRNNATFKAHYDSKRAEGRTHYNVLGYYAGKLVRVIWKILTDNVEFNLELRGLYNNIDKKRTHLKALLKLPFLPSIQKRNFFTNLYLTFHS